MPVSILLCFSVQPRYLSSDGNTLTSSEGFGRGWFVVIARSGDRDSGVASRLLSTLLGGARLTVKEAALLDGAAGLDAGDGAVVGVLRDAGAAVDGGAKVGDVLGDGMLGADGTGIDAIALAGLGHGVVARVEVLALLEMLGKVVGTRGQFAVEAEESLFLGGEGLWRGGERKRLANRSTTADGARGGS